ncbi:MAG: hypothetical protein ACK5JF_01910 [Oscillospiraceae bacterium]
MLKKVIKYEFQASGRILWPLSALVIALGCILRLLSWVAPMINSTAGYIVEALVSGFGPMIASLILFVFLIILVVRFYQGMSSNEAYLSFTLPVKVSTHIWARLIVGTIFSIVSGIVTFIFSLIALPETAETIWKTFKMLPVTVPFRTSVGGSVTTVGLTITHGMAALIAVIFLLFIALSYISNLLQM